jgi:hypothetical protein
MTITTVLQFFVIANNINRFIDLSVAFCRLLTGSVLLEFDQHQVICVLTKFKLSIEYKPVAKCSTGPETFQKAIIDKNDTHFAHSARFCMPCGEQTRCSCLS